MGKKKKPNVRYTEEERRKYLFKTAGEMRLINDKADSRTGGEAGSREDDSKGKK